MLEIEAHHSHFTYGDARLRQLK